MQSNRMDLLPEDIVRDIIELASKPVILIQRYFRRMLAYADVQELVDETNWRTRPQRRAARYAREWNKYIVRSRLRNRLRS